MVVLVVAVVVVYEGESTAALRTTCRVSDRPCSCGWLASGQRVALGGSMPSVGRAQCPATRRSPLGPQGC